MEVRYEVYESEEQLREIMDLLDRELSEPYSVFTYRYFLNSWGKYCIIARINGHCVGVIICKLENHFGVERGYIGMLAVEKEYRRKGIAKELTSRVIKSMQKDGCKEVVLETELINQAAIKFYERLGFVKDKFLPQYYIDCADAYRLKLWLE